MTAPRHVLLELDDEGDLQTIHEDDDDRSISSAAFGIESSATSFSEPVEDDSSGARTTSSRFWGVTWDRKKKKWKATYRDADGKQHTIGYFDDEEEAARARDQAIRDAGLEGKRRMNAVDASGALVPKAPGVSTRLPRDRSAVVAPDAARDPTATSSKFWGVNWDKRARRWQAKYYDANGKRRHVGNFDTQEDAAHAVNAAIRRAGLEGKRRTNPVVEGRLVPRVRTKKPDGHGPPRKSRKRRRDEPAAKPSTRARRQRRADE